MRGKPAAIGVAICFALLATAAYALFTNGGFEEGTFNGWTVEHGYNNGLTTTIDNGVEVPVAENIFHEDWTTPGYEAGGWTDNDFSFNEPRHFITSGTGNDHIALTLPIVKYGSHSARVNSPDYDYHATRISQQDTIAEADRDPADGRFHIRFAWAAVLQDPGHPPSAQPYFHIAVKKVSDNTVLYSQFFYSNQPGYPWRSDNVLYSGWKWIDWQEIDLDVTDNVVVGDAIRIELSAADCAYGGHGGYAFLDGFRSQASPQTGTPTTGFDLKRNALGNGGCSVAAGGRNTEGGIVPGAREPAVFFALLVAPLLLLKRIHSGGRARRSRWLFAFFIAAIVLVGKGADAGQISPKTQRFHVTADGLGAFTVDSGETVGQGKLNVFLGANYVKRPLNKGDVSTLTVQEDRVHNLLTFDLAGAYGLAPNFEVGFDIPFNLVQDGKDAKGADITDQSIGDIRVSGKWRFFSTQRAGVALVPFAVFPTGDDETFLSQKKFSYGAKFAAHCAAMTRITTFANVGVEFVSGWSRDGGSPDHYTAWIPFGVGAAYDISGKRKQALVGEVNGETMMDKPFGNQITTPIEWLLGYRAQVRPGWTMQVGGGRGFNKGIGAPQWRAFVGAVYSR